MEESAEMVAQRLHYLVGGAFARKRYRKPSEQWDHDHCAVCWQKLAEFETQGIQHEGFASTATEARPADYHWICFRCFPRFREVMHWNLVE